MKRLRWVTLLTACLVAPGILRAEHSPRLPQPQKIQYGPGRVLVRDLRIRLAASSSAEEDRFAAAELARRLQERTGITVSISSDQSTPAIVLERTGGVDPLPVPDEQPGPNSRESYELRVTPRGVEIRGKSSAAVFCGVQTLLQLVEGQGEQASLPEVQIQDWPLLAYRGPMVDMSHGALPTEAEVERQLDFLARWKANQFYFYNEASIQLDGYPLLNPEGRFSKAQVSRIIAYGRARHIDVIPCLELYGHLHDLFRLERYSDLAAFPHGEEFNSANPNVLGLLKDWADQISALFPSPFVHIGFDETWQIANAAKEQGAGATAAELFLEQLNHVAGFFQQHGKRVMAWGDIIVEFPDILAKLPRDIIAVAWYYGDEPDSSWYTKRLDPLAEKHVPHIIATGVNNWNEIAPDFDTAFGNIDTFLARGKKSHTLGLMNTVWTDDAQNLIRMAWPAIAYGAIAPWQTEPMNRARFFADYANVMYTPAVAPEAAAGLGKLALAETTIQKVLGRDSMLAMWGDPFATAALSNSQARREDLRQTRLLAEDAETHFFKALAAGGDAVTLASLLFGSRLIDYVGMKFQNGLEVTEKWQSLGSHPTADQMWKLFESDVAYQSHGRLADQMDGITELREFYRQRWLDEYTPYRLPSALGRWDAEYEYWRELQANCQAFIRSFREGQPLPAFEALLPGRPN